MGVLGVSILIVGSDLRFFGGTWIIIQWNLSTGWTWFGNSPPFVFLFLASFRATLWWFNEILPLKKRTWIEFWLFVMILVMIFEGTWMIITKIRWNLSNGWAWLGNSPPFFLHFYTFFFASFRATLRWVNEILPLSKRTWIEFWLFVMILTVL